eukprot:gene3451-biopygen3402
MCSVINMPITVDAAQLGSRAHRLRNYWTNLTSYAQAQPVIDAIARDPSRLVRDILDPDREERPASDDVAAGHYRCNVRGEPMRAWPTMMSFPDSYQFRGNGKGTVWDKKTQKWEAPTPEEKERATGFQKGTTKAPGVTARERGEMLGRAFDVRCVSHLMTICYLLNKESATDIRVESMGSMAEHAATERCASSSYRHPPLQPIPENVMASCVTSLGTVVATVLESSNALRRRYGKGATPSVVKMAQSHEPQLCGQAPSDKSGLGWVKPPNGQKSSLSDPIQFTPAADNVPSEHTHYVAACDDILKPTPCSTWDQGFTRALSAAVGTRETIEPTTNEAMLQWLRGVRQGDDDEQRAASTRARNYALEGDTLVRILPNGARPVPPVEQRARIVHQIHERLGHFGRRRTTDMVRDAFYWPDLHSTCVEVVSKCDACARYRTTFDKHAPHLNPLEVKGMYYRFSTDLARMPRKAKRNYQYAMVVVEHFTKYVCLIPLHTKEPGETARVFALHIIARFGCPAEVLTDNGGEWEKDFAQLLKDNLIDHRTTSQSHPQSNGLSERVIQMTKAALTKACAQAGSIDKWDSFLPWIMLGYNATPHDSTRLSTYELVYAQRPTLPPSIKERINQPLENCMDVDSMAASYLERAEYVKRAAVMAV